MKCMNGEEKVIIKTSIIKCRELLESDLESVLIRYGIYVDNEWEDTLSLSALNDEEKYIRNNIIHVIEKLYLGGYGKSNAVKEFIKEVAYTYLNRISAIKVLESRGLIDNILTPQTEHNGKSFGVSRFYEVARELGKYNLDNGLSTLLKMMFIEIAEDINILFEVDDEYSLIGPSNNTIINVVNILNSIDKNIWEDDEVIGWIYQFFIEKEKKETFERAASLNGEYGVHEVPAVTQFFTPKWIVRWLLDNSLSKVINEIKNGVGDLKTIDQIKILDPCCGSGHFLVKAYDMLYAAYVDEGIYSEKEIPFKILENNIFGIDIDLRAVQLTALILYIKTKTKLKDANCNVRTKGMLSVNLVCADSILLNGKKLDELKRTHSKNPVILKMIDIIFEEFEDSRLKGSLMMPEEKIYNLFNEYKERVAKNEYSKIKRNNRRKVEGQVNILGELDQSFSEYKETRDFTREENDLIESLDSIYKQAIKANDLSQQLFARDTKKTIKLIDIFMNSYDVITTNPPFMGRKYMNTKLKNFIDKNYKNTKNDLYSVFIERCISLSKTNGYIAMVTQNTFMFIKTYEKVRELILQNTVIEKLVHLGPRAFEEISGEKVTTAMYVLKKCNNVDSENGEYIKLDDIKNTNDKISIFNSILKGNYKERVFNINQQNFDLIEGKGFVYWIDNEISNIFSKNSKLIKYAKAVVGFQSGKDDYFFRYFWEVKRESIGVKWFNCAKGGENGLYFKNLPEVVLWENNGEELKAFKGSVIRNEDYYFKRAINSSLLGGTNYSARVLPDGYLFNVTSVNVFPYDEEDYLMLLGILNSSLSVYMLNLINPTLSITPGTLSKLPIKYPTNEVKLKIEEIVSENIDTQKGIISKLETSNIFESWVTQFKGYDDFESFIKEEYISRYVSLRKMEINNVIIDNICFDLFDISDELRTKITSSLGRYKNINKHICNLDQKDIDKIMTGLDKGQNITYICKKNGLQIVEVYNYLIENKIVRKTQIKNLINDAISYWIGGLFNRWYNHEKEVEEIIPFDSSIYLDEDITERIYNYLLELYGEEKVENIWAYIENILESNIEEYLMNEFFKNHISMYEKRPIYWQVTSPKKNFSCLIYYPKLTSDTLYKVRGVYLKQSIDRYSDDYNFYKEQYIKANENDDKKLVKELSDKIINIEDILADLMECDKKISDIGNINPNIDDGVLNNIIPLESIMNNRVSTEKEQKEYKKRGKDK